jgi:hypothetical protein
MRDRRSDGEGGAERPASDPLQRAGAASLVATFLYGIPSILILLLPPLSDAHQDRSRAPDDPRRRIGVWTDHVWTVKDIIALKDPAARIG